MSGRAWTPELIDELKRLRRRGYSYRAIARRLGVTRNAALGQALRLGVSVRVVPRRMCGHRAEHGAPWCAHHARRVFAKLSATPERRDAA